MTKKKGFYLVTVSKILKTIRNVAANLCTLFMQHDPNTCFGKAGYDDTTISTFFILDFRRKCLGLLGRKGDSI